MEPNSWIGSLPQPQEKHWTQPEPEVEEKVVFEVFSTGYCGGDAGHGGRTILRLQCSGGYCNSVTVAMPDGNGDVHVALDQVAFVDLTFCGDWEQEGLLEAFEWAIKKLRYALKSDQYGATVMSSKKRASSTKEA